MDLRIWNPLLYQLSYTRKAAPELIAGSLRVNHPRLRLQNPARQQGAHDAGQCDAPRGKNFHPVGL